MDWPHVEPIKSTRIYQEIVRQVEAMIAEGRLKSGDRPCPAPEPRWPTPPPGAPSISMPGCPTGASGC